LPETLVEVTEYQGHGRRCPGCGAITWAAIPAAVKAHGPGPRLATFLAYLSGRHHLSKRSVAELVTTVFQVPLAVGTVTKVERAMSHALAPAHAEVQQAVRAAPVKQVDETSWKLAGQLHWLWVAATTTLACFVIHVRRGAAGLTALLGEAITGIVGSDRWSVYNRLPVADRQICWAHLKRDFQKCVDRGGPAARLGADGLAVVALLFDAWYLFQAGRLDRAGLQAELAPLRRELQYVLTVGSRCRDSKAATFCQNLLAVYPALWTFAAVEGVEPTNNQAERVLRRGVLWRKQAYGCHSAAGCRFVERMLTVVQTLRLQRRAVWDYLYQALVAHRAGLAAPKLLSEG
jgi:transposase